MRKMIFILPAALFLTATAFAAKDNKDCRQLNPFYGAARCETCDCNAKHDTGCYELNPFYGATKCQQCPVKEENKLNPITGAARCHKPAISDTCKRKCSANKPARRAAAVTPAKKVESAPAKVQEDLAKVAKVRTTASGARLSFNTPILFASGSDNLQDSSSKDEIKKIAKVLKNHPTASVIVEGHTDSIGDPAANLELSKKRAKTVAQILVDEGVPANKVGYKGYGDKNPIASNKTREDRAKNRRVELDITVK